MINIMWNIFIVTLFIAFLLIAIMAIVLLYTMLSDELGWNNIFDRHKREGRRK